MAKKGKHKLNQSKLKNGVKQSSHVRKPLVSVCTPTFNRRPFIKAMIANFLRQDYPRDRMEWIIVDDGTDKIEDLVKNVPCVKYYYVDKKMSLGKKRNFMHDKVTGEILVYMDDDDYYPPCRVSHAVEMLQQNPKAMCAGSSEIYIWFNELNKMVQFGPYGPNHATAGTFAFRRRFLRESKYDDNAALAEEKAFLKNYTVPFVQLDPLKTILVFSHEHNTYDKRKLLENPHPDYVRNSSKTVEMFVKEEDAREFYTKEIRDALQDYEPGRPEMKPDVLEQTKKIEEFRRQELERLMAENAKKQSEIAKQGTIVYTSPDGTKKEMTNAEVVEILQVQHKRMFELEQRINDLERENEEKECECGRLRGLNKLLMDKLKEQQEAQPVLITNNDVDDGNNNVEKLLTEADVIIHELFGS